MPADQTVPEQVLRVVQKACRAGQILIGSDVLEIKSQMMQARGHRTVVADTQIPDQCRTQGFAGIRREGVGRRCIAATCATEIRVIIEAGNPDRTVIGAVVLKTVLLAAGNDVEAVVHIQLAGAVTVVQAIGGLVTGAAVIGNVAKAAGVGCLTISPGHQGGFDRFRTLRVVNRADAG